MQQGKPDPSPCPCSDLNPTHGDHPPGSSNADPPSPPQADCWRAEDEPEIEWLLQHGFFQLKGEGYLTFVASFTLANEEIKNNIDNSEIQFVQKRSLIYFRNETEDK